MAEHPFTVRESVLLAIVSGSDLTVTEIHRRAQKWWPGLSMSAVAAQVQHLHRQGYLHRRISVPPQYTLLAGDDIEGK